MFGPFGTAQGWSEPTLSNPFARAGDTHQNTGGFCFDVVRWKRWRATQINLTFSQNYFFDFRISDVFRAFFWWVTNGEALFCLVRCVKNANYSHEMIIYLCLCLLVVFEYIGTRVHQADPQEAQSKTYSNYLLVESVATQGVPATGWSARSDRWLRRQESIGLDWLIISRTL